MIKGFSPTQPLAGQRIVMQMGGALQLAPLIKLWLGERAGTKEGNHVSKPQVGHCWLNSVAPTQLRAFGPCRTLRVLTWSGHRGCWAASRQH